MTRLAFATALGVLCGATGAYFYLLPGDTRAPVVTRDLPVPVAMSDSEAEQHRAERFARLRNVAEVIALPGTFARSEAMHAIAGRSDSGAVQALIHDANRIADSHVREELLGILFRRLTDLDPASALALSTSRTLAAGRELERTVWQSWSRRDLDAAVAAVAALPTRAERDFAAQALFAAWGYHGNAVVERIARETGIEPSVSILAAYLRRLADASVADAVTFIDGIDSQDERISLARSLAAHLMAVDPLRAAGYASLFADERLGRAYSQVLARQHAETDPLQVLQALVDGGFERPDNGAVHTAMREYARRDLDGAIAMIDQLGARRDREQLVAIVAAEMAAADPVRAFDWARSFQQDRDLNAIRSVLNGIAGSDPDLALELVATLENSRVREQALRNIMMTMSRDDPARAVAIGLELQKQRGGRGMLHYTLSSWLRRDGRAAVAWLQTLDDRDRVALLRDSGRRLISEDVDAAIRLLPYIDDDAAAELRPHIVQELAAGGSLDRAQSFISQVSDGVDGDALRASLAAGLAKRDIYQALQVVEQIPAGRARDRSYAMLVTERAAENPLEAAGWLSSIADNQVRAEAAAGLVGAWYERQPDAAERWALSHADTDIRDHGIAALAVRWQDPTARQFELVDSIGDAALRHRAQTRQLYVIGRRDIGLAERRLEELDLPDMQRRDLRAYLDRLATGL